MSTESSAGAVRIGIIGCGGFGVFALQHFVQVPGVRVAAMAEPHREPALAAAKRFGIEKIDHYAEMVRRDDIDLIYIATPPFLHHEQALAALRAGKHVICEKPLAMTLEEADEMIATAREHDVLLVANLMQRYNPLFGAVGRLIDTRILGAPLHGYFENYAADAGLPPQHWFWDRDKSGGIFIEHGVHFFDLVAGWLGHGEVVAAQVGRRPGTEIEEHVQCTVRYEPDVLFNFYHGFHQPRRLDRQEMRLVFERGDVRLHEWIPTRFRIHGLVDETQTRELGELFPGARLDISAVFPPEDRSCHGRHNRYDVWQEVELSGGYEWNKQHRYGELMREMLADQVAWVRDRQHQRRITEANGRDSVAAACAADQLAHSSQSAVS